MHNATFKVVSFILESKKERERERQGFRYALNKWLVKVVQ